MSITKEVKKDLISKFSINENLIESNSNTFPFKQIIDAIAIDGNPYFSKCPECGLKVVFAGYKREPERTPIFTPSIY